MQLELDIATEGLAPWRRALLVALRAVRAGTVASGMEALRGIEQLFHTTRRAPTASVLRRTASASWSQVFVAGRSAPSVCRSQAVAPYETPASDRRRGRPPSLPTHRVRLDGDARLFVDTGPPPTAGSSECSTY